MLNDRNVLFLLDQGFSLVRKDWKQRGLVLVEREQSLPKHISAPFIAFGWNLASLYPFC